MPALNWTAFFKGLAYLVMTLIVSLGGTAYFQTWPFSAPAAETSSMPAPKPAMQRDLDGLAARVTVLTEAAASKADIAEIRAELSEIKAVLAKARPSNVTTGSVRRSVK